MRNAPRRDAPLLVDTGMHPDGKPASMDVSDWSSRVETGQQYVVADVRGDWTAIWYSGQKEWFYNSPSEPVISPAKGTVVTPRFGPILMYGAAYPERSAYARTEGAPIDFKPLEQYRLLTGQKYVAQSPQPICSEYLVAETFHEADHVLTRGQSKYFQIQYGNRIAYVNASDVLVVNN